MNPKLLLTSYTLIMLPLPLSRTHQSFHLLVTVLMLLPKVMLVAVHFNRLAPKRLRSARFTTLLAVTVDELRDHLDDLLDRSEVVLRKIVPLFVRQEVRTNSAGANALREDISAGRLSPSEMVEVIH